MSTFPGELVAACLTWFREHPAFSRYSASGHFVDCHSEYLGYLGEAVQEGGSENLYFSSTTPSSAAPQVIVHLHPPLTGKSQECSQVRQLCSFFQMRKCGCLRSGLVPSTIDGVTTFLNELLSTPRGFQRFAWHGMPLLLPTSWNLQAHRGDAFTGALFFVDLRSPRLEMRWHTPGCLGFFRRDANRLFRTQVAALRKRPGARLTEHAGYTRITTGESSSVLLVAQGRLLELHWPAQPEHLETIVLDLLKTAQRLAIEHERFWCVYGAVGWVPPRMTPKKFALLPGSTRLDFSRFHHRVTLGSFAMADRLLADTTLEKWATLHVDLLKRNSGQWKCDDHEARCTVYSRPWYAPLREREGRFCFLHDHAANRITWSYHV